MPFVPCVVRQFASDVHAPPDQVRLLHATWPEIVHAAITVGRRGWRDVWQHGAYSAFEMFYRASMIFANLAESPGGGLRKTIAHEWLDRSEKSAISYFLGLTFSKLVATRLLGVHWAIHLDVYAQHLQPTFTASGRHQRPDLVGRHESGGWCVLEAKGRSNKATDKAIQGAKEQTRALGKIGGRDPYLRVASIAHFVKQTLCVHLDDPEGADEASFHLDISEEQFRRDYYRPFTDLLDENRAEEIAVGGQRFRAVSVPGADLRVGLSEDVRNVAEKRESGGMLLGSDGVFVELGNTWSPEMMLREPPERQRGDRKSSGEAP